MARYLIGIDLGTTNSALAFIDSKARVKAGRPEIHTFQVPQLVAPGEVAARQLLPSFLYLPGSHDLPVGAAALPWDEQPNGIVGEFARQHGSRVPGRLISSAKSWLSHSGVDRSAALLPWTAPPDVPRKSPLDVSARYLRHLVEAWNHTHVKDPLEEQSVVLTVPASFDDVARNLTLEAAKKAGLSDIALLEEPQAAFYAWLHTATANELKPGMRCVVVDVGGGTSDFSLIAAVEERGELTFVREAVGDHLLLGGDNMDLALARAVETKLGPKLDAAQFGQLIQACRQAKEELLGPKPPKSVPVTVVGRGRSVVGGTLTATLTGDDVRSVLFEGFFPDVPLDAEPARASRGGLHEMGLPYVQDAAVTKHLAAFLRRHIHSGADTGGLDAILFNGGVFQPESLRKRLVEVMSGWQAPGWRPLVLTTPSLDLAVAWGAAAYAHLRHTGGKRIGGGLARAYYVGIENPPDSAGGLIPVLCVVPRHLEEEQEIVLSGPELDLTLGAPVLFALYSSTVRDDAAGVVLSVAPNQLLAMPPLTTVLRAGKRASTGPRQVPVTLAARSTAVGTLELHCVAKDGGARWRLEFNTREVVRPQDNSEEFAEGSSGAALPMDIVPEAMVQDAARLVYGTFSTAAESDPPPKELTKALETALESARDLWPMALCRRIADMLVQAADGRNRSPAHRLRWFNMLGYTLRPGTGDPLDRFRLDQLWKLLHAPKAGATPPPIESGTDVWIMWRRVAAGLPAGVQQTLFERAKPFVLPVKGKAPPKPGANELAEMWRAVAALERLDPKVKAQLGEVLLKQVRRSPAPTYAFWSLTRLGARVLFDGPLNAIVHPDIVGGWIDTLAGFEPGHESERRDWAFCLANLARRSGQRALDVDDARRRLVQSALHGLDIPEAWPCMVEELVEPERADRERMFGEALPVGLRLR